MSATGTKLDELERATQQWARAEKKRLEREVRVAKNILRLRTGAGRLQSGTVKRAAVLVADSVAELLGEGGD